MTARDTGRPGAPPQKEKGPTLVGPVVVGINSPANRPDPDDPGGLGAEESGTERTGPTQGFLFAMQDGGRLAEVGRYYDSANDPVTPYFPGWMGSHTVPLPANSGSFAPALLQPRAVGAIMSLR